MFEPILRGWHAILRPFPRLGAQVGLANFNRYLVGWMRRKHKKLAGHRTRAAETLDRLAQRQPRAFVHWWLGYLS